MNKTLCQPMIMDEVSDNGRIIGRLVFQVVMAVVSEDGTVFVPEQMEL